MEGTPANSILLVDDEPSILRSLQRLFRREGYEIKTAEGGPQALDQLGEAGREFSLIISDQRMPGMSGSEFLERSKEKAPDAIRFLLTGYSDLDAIIASVNKGEIHRYLTKPWNDKDLILQVRQGVEQYNLKRENGRLLELTRRQNKELAESNQSLERKVQERTKEISEKNTALMAANSALNQSFVDTVRLLTALIESLNPAMGRQMKKTAEYARMVAMRLGMADEDLDTVELAAMIHDIGLIGGSEALFRKDSGEMTPSELTEFRQHPTLGSVCLQHVDRMKPVAEIVLNHHEAFDGSGFPSGIAGEDIPIGARIIAPVSDYLRLLESWPESMAKIMARARRLLGDRIDELLISDMRTLIPELTLKIVMARAQGAYDPDIVWHLTEILGQQDRSASADSTHNRIRKVHYSRLEIGMKTAFELRTCNGRFVLPADTTLNRMLIKGLQRLGNDGAIPAEIPVSGSCQVSGRQEPASETPPNDHGLQ